jgi:hypothetical protein
MERPATWKVLTLGAALTGLSVSGAQAAQAETGSAGTAPASVSAATDLNAPLFDSPWGSWGSPWIPGENLGHWVPWRPGQIVDNWAPWIPGPWGPWR